MTEPSLRETSHRPRDARRSRDDRRRAGHRTSFAASCIACTLLVGCAPPLDDGERALAVRAVDVTASPGRVPGPTPDSSPPSPAPATATATDETAPDRPATAGPEAPTGTPPAPAEPPRSEATGATGATTTPAVADRVRIDAPLSDSVVAGPEIDVTGVGTAFEGTLRWRVTTSGSFVTHGFTTAGANGAVGPFEFTVRLGPGTYTVEVWEPRMAEDGAASGTSTNGPAGAATTFTVAAACAA